MFREVRDCLKLDADHKQCHDHYKKVKKLAQHLKSVSEHISEQKWSDCISRVDQILKVESKIAAFVHKADAHRCHCYSQVC